MKIDTDAVAIILIAILGSILGVWWQFSALIIWIVEMTATTIVGLVVFSGIVAGVIVTYGAYSIIHTIKAHRLNSQFDLMERRINLERLAQTPIILEQIKTGHTLALSGNLPMQMLHNVKPVDTAGAVPSLVDETNNVDVLDIVSFIGSNHHYWLNGITGDGKTTLCIEFLNLIRLPFPSANVAILDPKNSADWPIEPIATSVTQIVPMLDLLCDDLQQRVDNQDYDSEPVIIIVDEHDWLHDELKKDYDSKVRFISKVGRQLNYHIIVMGQSPLSRDNGMSQSSLNNFGRVIFGNEGLKMLNNSAFPFVAIKSQLKLQLQTGIDEGLRVALIWPSSKQLPYVAEIPNLANSGVNFEAKPMKLLPQLSAEEQAILDTFDELSNGKPATPYAIHKKMYGKKPSGGSATNLIKATLMAYRSDSLKRPPA